jgi:hypothetical protein
MVENVKQKETSHPRACFRFLTIVLSQRDCLSVFSKARAFIRLRYTLQKRVWPQLEHFPLNLVEFLAYTFLILRK